MPKARHNNHNKTRKSGGGEEYDAIINRFDKKLNGIANMVLDIKRKVDNIEFCVCVYKTKDKNKYNLLQSIAYKLNMDETYAITDRSTLANIQYVDAGELAKRDYPFPIDKSQSTADP